MSRKSGLLLVPNARSRQVIEAAGARLELQWRAGNDSSGTGRSGIADFLLELVSGVYHVLLVHCTCLGEESVKWIHLIRILRPRLPLIVVQAGQDLEFGARLLELGVFYLAQEPPDEAELAAVFKAALRKEFCVTA